ncbi:MULTISPECIES: VOC family protein [unclassified Lysobacter]|uniref:VOC family protein n=1 Tax=unclassified Lysobacter TaxID=2635362 RepID=UPI0006FC0E7A|nr:MULTISPECIES: VOC family protein [unclassified Lysobacter]KQZ66619.1 glyoxalase [Lysobacter sp. Root559]KRA72003.1 glyoxalase [Lysobacter sp. Root667]KRC32771.1 glyoxalase [Lysobacter sp. Root76]KRD67885.1 glyoxalase [Lysobacter sp. Root96]
MAVQPRPDGYHSVTPYVIVHDAAAAIDFYVRALDATEIYRLPMGDKIGHAEIRIGDSVIMMSDEWPEMNALSPKTRGGATTAFMIYVADADAAFDKAVKAGGKVDKPLQNQFWGDRTGTIVDPFGHKWTLATHVEDVSEEEMQSRMQEWSQQQGA